MTLFENLLLSQSVVANIFVFAIGACLGSFVSAWAVRYLKNQSIVTPFSACDWCRSPLNWWMKIPIISFLILKGQTRCCQATIPRIYWVNEMVMGIFCLKLWQTLGGLHPSLFSLCSPLLLGNVLLLVSTTDLICRIIPNRFVLAGIVGNFLLLALGKNYSGLTSAVLGLVLGYSSLAIVSWLYETLRKREGMGGGDIKLFAMLGCFLGAQALPFIIFYASFIAVIFFGMTLTFQKKFSLNSEVPFGPFLSLAAILYLFWGTQIIWWL